MELVDMLVSEASAVKRVGSIPTIRTKFVSNALVVKLVVHRRFKISRRKACQFESDLGHQSCKYAYVVEWHTR
jgi:hypothetical protein